MASNTNNSPIHQVVKVRDSSAQVTERTNAEGLHETVVDTVDYRSNPGTDPQGQLSRENVQVIHQHNPDQEASKPGADLLAGAVAAVSNTVKSAKDAISGGTSDTGAGTLPK